jgi:hypothetical protein
MVVEHLPNHPKVEGLSAATAAGTGRDKIGEKTQQLKPTNEWCQNKWREIKKR